MKTIISSVAFFLALSASVAQSSFIDSLKQDLRTVKNDSLKFRLLDELAWSYKRSNFDTAMHYALQARALVKGGPRELLSIAHSTIGILKKDNGEPDYGVPDLNRSLKINRELKDKKGMASNFNNLGSAYTHLGNYDSALIHYTRSIELKRELGDLKSAARVMSNISLLYEQINNIDKAIEYLNQALEILGDGNESGREHNNMGLLLNNQGKYLEARRHFRISLRGALEKEDLYAQSIAYGNIGLTFSKRKEYDSGIFFTKKALEIKKQLGQKGRLSYPAITLAETYADMQNYEEARIYAQLAYDVTKDGQSLERKAEAIWILGKVEANLGKFEEAAQLFFDYTLLSDSLYTLKVLTAAEEAEAQYQNKLKEQENEALSVQSKAQDEIISNQRIMLTIIGVILLTTLILAYFLRKQLLERNILVAKIEKQSAKLKELDKAKTRFFANISHDLRTPLSLILAAFDNVQSRDDKYLDKESKEELKIGHKNARRLLFMADEIMDITRIENGHLKIKPQLVKISLYLQLLVKMFHSAADIKSIRLDYKSEVDQDTLLKLDPYQFEKVIYNLMSNAIKHTPRDGAISVKLSEKQELITVEIADTGAGIDQDSIPYIFDRFYQSVTNSYGAREGIGIGLALVKEIVDLHHASISVSSQLGQGTTFRIDFPYDPSEWSSEAGVPNPSTQLMAKNSLWTDLQDEIEAPLQVPGLDSNKDGKCILIVEDHKEVRAYLKSILSSDFRIITASNGSDALELLKVEKIDLILTDLMMPVMDGFEMIDHLDQDKTLNNIPIIVISARSNLDEKIALLEKGAQEVLRKPFDKEELVAKINNTLNDKWDKSKALRLGSEELSKLEKEVLRKVENLVLSRIDDPHLSVMDISDELAASERKVYRLIKKLTGHTPFEFIKEIRLQYIFNELESRPYKTATEAAEKIGMSNPSDFAAQFERRFKSPLSDYLSKN